MNPQFPANRVEMEFSQWKAREERLGTLFSITPAENLYWLRNCGSSRESERNTDLQKILRSSIRFESLKWKSKECPNNCIQVSFHVS